MRIVFACLFAASGLLVAGCDYHDGTSPLTSDRTIHLTQAQAATLVSRVSVLAPVHSELAWLADSVGLVLKAGAEADRIEVTTDLATGPFYAVGLRRAARQWRPADRHTQCFGLDGHRRWSATETSVSLSTTEGHAISRA